MALKVDAFTLIPAANVRQSPVKSFSGTQTSRLGNCELAGHATDQGHPKKKKSDQNNSLTYRDLAIYITHSRWDKTIEAILLRFSFGLTYRNISILRLLAGGMNGHA